MKVCLDNVNQDKFLNQFVKKITIPDKRKTNIFS